MVQKTNITKLTFCFALLSLNQYQKLKKKRIIIKYKYLLFLFFLNFASRILKLGMFLNTIVFKIELKNLILNEPIFYLSFFEKKDTVLCDYFTFELHNACLSS